MQQGLFKLIMLSQRLHERRKFWWSLRGLPLNFGIRIADRAVILIGGQLFVRERSGVLTVWGRTGIFFRNRETQGEPNGAKGLGLFHFGGGAEVVCELMRAKDLKDWKTIWSSVGGCHDEVVSQLNEKYPYDKLEVKRLEIPGPYFSGKFRLLVYKPNVYIERREGTAEYHCEAWMRREGSCSMDIKCNLQTWWGFAPNERDK